MKTLLSWSSGKDSAWSLHVLKSDPDVEICGLFTTLNEAFDRVAMHGVRRELVEAQAEAAGLPVHFIPLPHPCPNEIYEAKLGAFVEKMRDEGIEGMAFGDLFLQDIRSYREDKFTGTGIEPIFPIWGTPTDELAQQMVAAGLRAEISCLDPRQLPQSFAGRTFDRSCLAELPSSVDPCGERGEFHTFASAGPMFASPIPVIVGEIVTRDGFVFADLLPAAA